MRINTPDTKGRNDLREKAQNLRVGIAGDKANVDKAKKIMKEILRYHHHDLTHPGVVHEEMSVPPSQYSLLIGPRKCPALFVSLTTAGTDAISAFQT